MNTIYLLLNATISPEKIKGVINSTINYIDTYIICFHNSIEDVLYNEIKTLMDNSGINNKIIKTDTYENHSINNLMMLESEDANFMLFMSSYEIFNCELSKKDLLDFLNTNKYSVFSLNCNIIYKDEIITFNRTKLIKNDKVYEWKYPLFELINAGTYYFNSIQIITTDENIKLELVKNYEKYLDENNLYNNYTIFHLARCYEILNDYTKSFNYYNQRIEYGKLTDDDHEYYVSCLKCGCYSQNQNEKVYYLRKGIYTNPDRLECYFYLLTHYLVNNNYKKAYKIGCNVTNEKIILPNYLFAEKYIYLYKFEFNYAIAALNWNKSEHAELLLSKLYNMYPFIPHIKTEFEKLNKSSKIVISKHNKLTFSLIDRFYSEPINWLEQINELKFDDKYSSSEFTFDEKLKIESIIGVKINNQEYLNGKFVKNVEKMAFEKSDNYFGIVNLSNNNLEIIYLGTTYKLSYNNFMIFNLSKSNLELINNELSKIFLFN